MPPPPLPRVGTNPSPEPFVPPMSEQDLTAIRSRYLGADKKKRKIRKMNDRKFVFDWDAQDDTFAEDSPVAVGSNRQGAQIMFGRGHLAGMDDSSGSGVRRVTGEDSDNLADAMERRKAAKSGIDERHWTEKPLGEMKERDWRIFREDFSISARGISCSAIGDFDLLLQQVATSPIPYGHGQSLKSLKPSSNVLNVLATKNRLLSNDKLFPSVFRTVTSSALLRQVPFIIDVSYNRVLMCYYHRFRQNGCLRHTYAIIYWQVTVIYG